MGKVSPLKKCAKCGSEKPLTDFHLNKKRNQPVPRCKSCYGVGLRTCAICKSEFEGLASKILCSPECRKIHRPQTMRRCANCGVTFGPVGRLSVKFCSQSCHYESARLEFVASRVTTSTARVAQSRVARAIKDGKLSRPAKCEECQQDAKIEAAHHDYAHPLRVRWLCRSCHVKWDRKFPKGGTVAGPLRRNPKLLNQEAQ